ncbi:TetR/AcrR family transcriptional regulator [Shewanella surugensis]|uniref:TetR/AcrR family transcriptional regulator n=1 Tax=Shewanella surugensis TaxID=212020 RepID=A0ABT0LG98_9GAMM|nr:TetR/AcrR family transcriptional regulator [Shewanella surugensis]MCL1126703.1 TetR/AcrR family transcriptional regulator [Shewanella surugensis]
MKLKDKKLTRSDIKRASILDAAMNAFQSKGFNATSMDDITLSAAVSKRTVYNHFPSKETLFNAITARMLTLFFTYEPIPFSKDISLEIQLKNLVEHEINLLTMDEFIAMAKVIFAESIHSPQLVQNAMSEFEEKGSPLVHWFEQAALQGAIKTDHPERVSMQFVAVIKGFCFWPQLIQNAPMPDEKQLDDIAQMTVQMILKQYT